MLNLIWLGLLLFGVLVAGITGQFAAINQGALNAAKSAVMDVALPLCGAMTLWLGMVRLAEKSGLIQHIARFIRPVLARLFADVPSDHPAMGSIVMNMAANMLGVSNAATPLGLTRNESTERTEHQARRRDECDVYLPGNQYQFHPACSGHRHQYPRHQWFEKSDGNSRFHLDRDFLRHLIGYLHRQVSARPRSVSLGKADWRPDGANCPAVAPIKRKPGQ